MGPGRPLQTGAPFIESEGHRRGEMTPGEKKVPEAGIITATLQTQVEIGESARTREESRAWSGSTWAR